MIQLSFPTKKLKKYIKRVNIKLKDTNYNQNDLTVYGVTNTEGITITGNQTSEDLSNYIILKENQLAYNPYRVNVGSIGLAPKGFIGLVSPAYVVFETTEELSAEFLYYYLKSSLGINLIKWYGDRGGVRSALRYNDLCEIDIPDLTLNQQISLLNKMKKLNTEIEGFNNEVHYQEQLISKLRQSILQEAVQGKLVPQDPNDEPASVLLERIKEEKERLIKEGKIKKEKPLPPITEDEIPYELPKGWEWVRLGEIGISNIGLTYKPTDIGSKGIPVLRANNIKNGKIDYNDLILVDKKVSENLLVKKDDILICVRSGSKALVGKAALIEKENMTFGAFMAVYRSCCNKYIHKFINSSLFRQQLDGANTTTINQITQNMLKNIIFPLPPLNEQKRIVEKVDQLIALCDELEKNIEQSKKDSELLMQSVLQEAFKEA